jgi:hypothetical protein
MIAAPQLPKPPSVTAARVLTRSLQGSLQAPARGPSDDQTRPDSPLAPAHRRIAGRAQRRAQWPICIGSRGLVRLLGLPAPPRLHCARRLLLLDASSSHGEVVTAVHQKQAPGCGHERDRIADGAVASETRPRTVGLHPVGVGSSAIATTVWTPRAACWWLELRWPSKPIGAATATSLRLVERRSRSRDSRSAGRATRSHVAYCQFRRVKRGTHEPAARVLSASIAEAVADLGAVG